MIIARTIRTLAIVCLLCISAPALGQGAGARTLAQLAKPLTVNVQDSRFEDVVEFVRTSTGATVDIAWINNRFSDGLDPEALVTVNAKGIPAMALLMLAAQQASLDGFDDPTWQLDQQTGAIQIGPRSRLNKFKRLEIYDINDLIFVLPDYKDVPRLNLNSVIRQGQGGGGSGIFQQATTQESDSDPELEADRIMDILRAVIETDQWIDNGGEGATVRFYDGSLLVSAPDYIHRQINGYDFLMGPVGRPPLRAEKPESKPNNEAQPEAQAEAKTEAEANADAGDHPSQ